MIICDHDSQLIFALGIHLPLLFFGYLMQKSAHSAHDCTSYCGDNKHICRCSRAKIMMISLAQRALESLHRITASIEAGRHRATKAVHLLILLRLCGLLRLLLSLFLGFLLLAATHCRADHSSHSGATAGIPGNCADRRTAGSALCCALYGATFGNLRRLWGVGDRCGGIKSSVLLCRIEAFALIFCLKSRILILLRINIDSGKLRWRLVCRSICGCLRRVIASRRLT